MRKTIALVVLVLLLVTLALAAKKESGSTTLKDIQPAGTTDKKHKKQQFDLTLPRPTTSTPAAPTRRTRSMRPTGWLAAL